MTSEQPPAPATSQAVVAAAYEQGRPGYPREAADWLVGGQALSVLELGAGTGKLTGPLAEAGHDVHAVEPEPAMLKVLRQRLPRVRTTEAAAEDVTVPDRSVDVVVCAASFHRFDAEAVLPRIARALRPGGHLALVWHEPDERIPWVRRLGRLLGDCGRQPEAVQDLLVHSSLFSFVEEKSFKAWQEINRDSIRDFVLSRSSVAALSPDATEDKIADVRDLYDEYGRGMDGMQLPHQVRCLRTQVVHQPGLFGDAPEPRAESPAHEAATSGVAAQDGEPERSGEPEQDGAADAAAREARRQENFRSDGTDTDMLLIDFR